MFVEALNTPGAVPNVQNAWDTFVQTKCSEVLADAVKDKTNSIFSSWLEKNNIETETFCTQLIKKLKSNILDPVLARLRSPEGSTMQFGDIVTAYNKIQQKYSRNARGAKDVQTSVFMNFHPELQKEMKQNIDLLQKMKDYDMSQAKEKAAKAALEERRQKIEEEKARIEKEKRKKEREVFPLGHLLDPETMGIWLWVVPEKFKDSTGREFTVVLMDSEGIDAVSSKQSDDHRIFTLSVLLSSIMIYNSAGVPNRSDLEGLDFIVKLSQRIQLHTKQQPTDDQHFYEAFPYFVWLLRDVVLDLPTGCKTIKDYFIKNNLEDQREQLTNMMEANFEEQRKDREAALARQNTMEDIIDMMKSSLREKEMEEQRKEREAALARQSAMEDMVDIMKPSLESIDMEDMVRMMKSSQESREKEIEEQRKEREKAFLVQQSTMENMIDMTRSSIESKDKEIQAMRSMVESRGRVIEEQREESDRSCLIQ
ncbi:Guanylate-binding protein 4 [Exaiptasia diaphana]|nr:Guanylate-binding protein 4 [Exaiptasia diaphana]